MLLGCGQMDQGRRAQLAEQEASCSQQHSELNTSLGDLQGRTSPKAEAVRCAVGIFRALDSTGEGKGNTRDFLLNVTKHQKMPQASLC